MRTRHPIGLALPSFAAVWIFGMLPGLTPRPVRHLNVEVTAYCACEKCCGPSAAGITASGKTVDYNHGRFVAADTSVLPFGSKLIIPGYGEGQAVEVIDRGGAIKGNRIDVFFADHDEARQWGRQKLRIAVVDVSAVQLSRR